MELTNIIAELSNAPVAAMPNTIEAFLLRAAALKPSENKPNPPMPTAYFVGDDLVRSDASKSGVVMVLPVTDFITKNSIPELGILGTKDLSAMHKAGLDDPNVVGFVLYADSGGGSVNYLAEFADQLYNSTKPVVAYTDNLNASAMYYMTVAARYHIATPKSSLIGNIGTKLQFLDFSAMLEKWGIKEITIFGDLATEKDLGYDAAKKGNLKPLRDALVNPHNEMFVADVKRMRPKVKEAATHGMVYLSEQAVKMGLVDALGSFDDAVNKVFELAKTPIKNTNNLQNKSSMSQKKSVMASLIAAFTGEELSAEEKEQLVESTQKVGNLEAQLAAANAQVDAIKAEKTDLQNQLDTANQTIVTLNQEKADLQSKIDNGLVANQRTTVHAAADQIDGSGKDDGLLDEASAKFQRELGY